MASLGADSKGSGYSPGGLLAAGVLYFLVVFGCGFVLGVGRVLWLLPRVGERWAELIETPFMLAVVFLVARWVSRRFSLEHRGRPAQAAVGLFGLALLVGAELGIVLQLRGLSLSESLAERDPISGVVYAVSLLLFAAMPTLVNRRRRRRSE